MNGEFIHYGRPDGIVNRIEKLIFLQEFCEKKI